MNRMSCSRMIAMVVVPFAVMFSSTAYAGLSFDKKMQVWKYFTRFEDIYGMEKAETLTARKFGMSETQLESIKAEGRTKNWPSPGQEREQDYYAASSEENESVKLETELNNRSEETDKDTNDNGMTAVR